MKNIHRVVDDEGEIKLMVVCWHCHRKTMLGEEDTMCSFCMNEIEETNMAAWTEYEKENPEPTLYI